jgi:hypothetical protein
MRNTHLAKLRLKNVFVQKTHAFSESVGLKQDFFVNQDKNPLQQVLLSIGIFLFKS